MASASHTRRLLRRRGKPWNMCRQTRAKERRDIHVSGNRLLLGVGGHPGDSCLLQVNSSPQVSTGLMWKQLLERYNSEGEQ